MLLLVHAAAAATLALATFTEPSAVAVGPDGSIHVCDAARNRISVFDRSGVSLRAWTDAMLRAPRGIAVAPDGTVYVSDTGHDRIVTFTAQGIRIGAWGRSGSGSGEFFGPEGIAADAGRVYVAEPGRNRVQVFDRAGRFLFYVWSYGIRDGQFDRPVDVAAGPGGRFYVLDQGNCRVQEFDQEGRFVRAWGGRGPFSGLFAEPGSIDVAGRTIVVADTHNHRVQSFDLEGQHLVTWRADQESWLPGAVAIVSGGGVFVACDAAAGRCTTSHREDSGPPRFDVTSDYQAAALAGETLVATTGRGAAVVFDISGDTPKPTAMFGGYGRESPEFVRPSGLAIDRARGRVLISDAGNARLAWFALGGRPRFVRSVSLYDEESFLRWPGRWPIDPALMVPGPVARSRTGRIYAIDTSTPRIVTFDPDLRATGSFGHRGEDPSGLLAPIALALDPTESVLYVLDAARKAVILFGADGLHLATWSLPATGRAAVLAPSDLAVAGDGIVYIADRRGNTIKMFTSRGTFRGAFGRGPAPFVRPAKVLVDARGRLFVIDSDGRRLQVFSSRGDRISVTDLDAAQRAARDIEPALPEAQALRGPDAADAADAPCAPRVPSNDGRYLVCARPKADDVPLNETFALDVWVWDAAEPSDQATLSQLVGLNVEATMPEHGHGMAQLPKIQAVGLTIPKEQLPDPAGGHGAVGNGRFEVQGLLFHMAGRWLVAFDIARGAAIERAQFELDLQPRARSVPVALTQDERRRALEHSPLGTPPVDSSNAAADDPAAARLGKALFFDTRLSSDGSFSCASCHVPHHAFSDTLPVSQGLRKGTRRTPSLINVAMNRWLFWDGRRDSLWSQALTPIESEYEMGGSRLGVAHVVASDPALRSGYETVFGPLTDLGDPKRFPAQGKPPDDAWTGMPADDQAAVSRIFTNVGKAIAAYERRLLASNAPFDRYVADLRAGRESQALSADAVRGLKLFLGRARCALCHSGPNFTDGEFHNTGIDLASTDSGRFGGIDPVLADPFNRLGTFADAPPPPSESLRFLKRTPESWGQFKTPSLRNVALRPPYMHQGQFASLRDVVAFYSTRAGSSGQERVLAPLRLTDAEIDDLVAFLRSLTDDALDPALMGP